MEAKHTPGPWAPGYNDPQAIYAEGTSARIASVEWARREKLANARLIAAAPDMLEALREAARWLDVLPIEYRNKPTHPGNMVRAAIAKAGG